MDYPTCFYTIATLYMLGASLMLAVVSAVNEVSKDITFFVVLLTVLLWPMIVLVTLIKKSYLTLKS